LTADTPSPRHEPEGVPRPDDEVVDELVDEFEQGVRGHRGPARRVIPVVAAAWSLFQLSLPKLVLLPSETVRAVHLAFAVALAFLSFPALRRLKRGPAVLSSGDRLPWIDVALALVAAASACYMVLDYEGIAERMGDPSLRDILVGGVLIVLLLEATRRALGAALAVLATLFLLYCRFAEYVPDAFAFRSRGVPYIVSKIALGTEGVFGVPLDVSASTVFLFVLFGAMLAKSGGGRFFVQLAFSLLGRFKGGPAKAAVLASGLTGMVSGSSIANTVTTGTFTIPLMKRAGYPAEKAAAVEVAASTNGQLMPPIMGAAAFIIAEYCRVPYIDVVRAAIVPAVISYIALIYITHLEASKLGLKGLPRAELPGFRDTLLSGIHFLIPIGFLLYQLIVLRHSPQLSAFWAIVALAVLIVVRNLLVWSRGARVAGPGGPADPATCVSARSPLLGALRESAHTLSESLVAGGRGMVGIGVAVAAAGIIVGSVTMGPGQLITDAVDTLAGGSIILILILTAIASLVLGMGLPTTATYIVMASLTARVITDLAGGAGLAVPLIAAHLFVFYFGILADDTPPVGLAAYAASAIAKSPPIRTGVQGFAYDLRTALLPFMFIFNTELLLLRYVDGSFVRITSWPEILIVFGTGAIAMLAFAALTQNYFAARNRLHEALLLLLVTAVLLRPGFFAERLGWGGRSTWYAVGGALFGGVYLLQRARARGHAGDGPDRRGAPGSPCQRP
jgi:TRAP transporter 4TM/12TM fusion protein